MPNHVHLVATPSDKKGLALAVGRGASPLHRVRGGAGRCTGRLFRGRFASVAMGEDHFLAAFRDAP
jgi:putative transposase